MLLLLLGSWLPHHCLRARTPLFKTVCDVLVASKASSRNRSNSFCFLTALDKRAFCESLVTLLGQESFDTAATITRIRGFDGEAPSQSNNFCCVDATEDLSEFRGLVEINGTQYCFIAQINSDDQHRARFIPAQDVLEEPSGKPRKMQPIIQEMILGRKRGVMLIPECEDDAVDVIAGFVEQGFHDLASEYRDFIIGQMEKAKAKAGA